MVKVEGYELREDLYYWHGGKDDHGRTWAKLEPDGRVRIGLTDLAQKLAGKIRFIRTKPKGTLVNQGKDVATLETGKWVGPVESPVSGTVDETNEALKTTPEVLTKDPYGEGWIAVLRPSNPEELKNLVQGKAAVNWYRREIKKTKENSTPSPKKERT